jgi:AraC-like DNA-binding protein
MTYNMSRLLQQIDGQLQKQPRLALHDLEKQLGVGRHTIEKAIRRATGKSFREYQSQQVLAEATRMLSGSALLQIKQVALSLGYSSPKSFSRYFKSHVGVTPSAFMANPASSGPKSAQRRNVPLL